ncbi:REST corepressor 3 [Fasciola gigantica]|uniref:REST corepressor 3 n=1 Tax=Fasciola gigantica TaxID=46835 RepID=A0A504Z712_FASGI|nr:REST corepressor 3 [Fasciola gigantica]
MSEMLTRGRLSQSFSNSDQDAFENAVIRVGIDFQVDLPPFQGEPTLNIQNEPDRGVALWRPISEAFSNDLASFLTIAIERHGYSEEQALALLTWHKADFHRAKSDLPNFSPLKYEWTPSERRVFFVALDYYNKQFHKIKKLFPTRTVNELILFYYLNKRNQQTLYEMSLHGPRWTGLPRRGYMTPGIVIRNSDGNSTKTETQQKSSPDLDPKDPMDAEIRTYLDSLHGIVNDSSSSTTSLGPGGSFAVDSDENDAESRNPEDEDEDEEVRSKGSKQGSGRKRRRPRGRPRNTTTHTNLSTSHAASLVGAEFGRVAIGRLSMRKHARFEEELAAVATTLIHNARGEAQNVPKDPVEGGRRSRRGVVCLQTPTTQSSTNLPAGTFYVHKQFQESCCLSLNQHKDEMSRLEEVASALSVRVDEHVRRAAKASALLDGMQNLRPPPIGMDPNWSVVDIQMAAHSIGHLGRNYKEIASRLVNKTPSMVATLFELYGQQLNLGELASVAPLSGR